MQTNEAVDPTEERINLLIHITTRVTRINTRIRIMSSQQDGQHVAEHVVRSEPEPRGQVNQLARRRKEKDHAFGARDRICGVCARSLPNRLQLYRLRSRRVTTPTSSVSNGSS